MEIAELNSETNIQITENKSEIREITEHYSESRESTEHNLEIMESNEQIQ